MNLNDLIKKFEQNFGRMLSPIEIQQITDWMTVDGFEIEVLEYAPNECVLNNARTLKYFNSIMRRCANNGFKTIEAIQLHEANRNQRKQEPVGNVPVWSKEHPEHEKLEQIPVAENMELFECFKKWFFEKFNMNLMLKQYREFAELCKDSPELQFNPFQMCAWILKKPVSLIEDRFFTKNKKSL